MTKTTRVMLAVLAACGASAAMAQSSVNLYGRVNTSIEHQKLGNSSATGMVSNSSFIGFRGTEDLGNGLKVGFILESRFASDNGGNSMSFGRQSEVNLSGNFGTLRLGNFDSAAMYAINDPVSMHNHDSGTSADAFAGNYVQGGNKIAYVTPNFSGFTAEAQYQFGEKSLVDGEADSESKGGFDLALNYANGPLAAGLGYSQAKNEYNLGAEKEKVSQYGGYAAYTVGDLTLAGYYQKQTNDDAGVKTKRDIYRLAAKYVIGASELHANFGRASKQKVDGVKIGESANQWTLAYNYNLSKRTKVYALYTNINNTVSAGLAPRDEFNFSNTSNSDKFRAYGVGIRHLF